MYYFSPWWWFLANWNVGFLNKEILRMIAAAVFVFNFLVNLRLKQINLPAYGNLFLKLFTLIIIIIWVINFWRFCFNFYKEINYWSFNYECSSKLIFQAFSQIVKPFMRRLNPFKVLLSESSITANKIVGFIKKNIF